MIQTNFVFSSIVVQLVKTLSPHLLSTFMSWYAEKKTAIFNSSVHV